jgi:ZIP family zinc transporter
VDPLVQGVVTSLLAGLATGLGAIPVMLGLGVSHRMLDATLGFAAGIMLGLGGGALLADLDSADVAVIAAALVGGAVVLALRGMAVIEGAAGGARLKRGTRVALVVTLHNLVEGMAVVATFGQLGSSVGTGVGLAIAVHNVPEGIAVAEPLRRAGVPPARCALLALASGLGEPLGALLAALALVPVLPPGAAAGLAAGAMIVLASSELIPEAFSHAYVMEASVGLLTGVLLALLLVAPPG